jgi:MFS family permease
MTNNPRDFGSGGNVTGDDHVDENTPLLATQDTLPSVDAQVSEATTLVDSSSNDEHDKPLPVAQILLLCYARFSEPIAFFCIFPYVNQMVQENGDLDYADVGFYTSLIESLFSLTQMMVMILWGKAADRVGRKPVLVVSLLGLALSNSVFGFAKTIWQMMLFRCLAGVFSGSVVTIRAMISEHSTAKTQARAFSWLAFSGNVGIFIGPLIGAALEEPATQYPGVFGNTQFLLDYPYALPTLLVGFFGLTSFITSALFIKETLVREPITTTDHQDDSEAVTQMPPPPPKLRDILKSQGVTITLASYSFVMLLAMAYTAICPLAWFTPVELGGWAFKPKHITMFLVIAGVAQSLWVLIVFPPLQNRIGTLGVLRIVSIFSPLAFATPVILNLLLRQGSSSLNTLFWIIAPALQVFLSGISLSFTAVQLALNDVSPSPHALATLNALILTLVSGIRAFVPALFTTLFAISVGNHLLWGHAIWVLMMCLAGGLTVLTYQLPNTEEIRKVREEQQQQQQQQQQNSNSNSNSNNNNNNNSSKLAT